MKKNEKLERYLSNYFKKDVKRLEADVLHQLQINKKEVYNSFIQNLNEIIEQVRQVQMDCETKPLSYISYSLVYVDFLKEQPLFTVEAFDENWFLFPSICEQSYEIEWLSKRLQLFYKDALKEQKKYLGKITPSDVEKFVLTVVQRMFKHVMSALKDMVIISPLNEVVGFDSVRKENFTLTIGNYRGLFRVLYKEEEA